MMVVVVKKVHRAVVYPKRDDAEAPWCIFVPCGRRGVEGGEINIDDKVLL